MTPSVAIVGDEACPSRHELSPRCTIRSGENPRTQENSDLQRARSEFEAIVDSECKNANEIPYHDAEKGGSRTKRGFRQGYNPRKRKRIYNLWSYYFPYYKRPNVGGCLGMPEQTCFGMGVVGASPELILPDLRKLVPWVTQDSSFP